MQLEHFESLYPDNTRFAEIEKILGFIKGGDSVQIVSLPGVGRSNLLGLLAFNRNVRIKHLGASQKNFHFVYLNFSELRKRPLVDVIKFIFIGLSDSLRYRKMEKEFLIVEKILKESLKVNDEMYLFSGLKKTIDFLALEKKLSIVFLFNRFEDYLPFLQSEFFANLRVLRNRAKYKFSVVFSLNRPLEETFEPTFFSDFYDFFAGKVVFLPISDRVGVDFRISYLEKISNKKIDKALLEDILNLTGGHSNLVRLSIESVLATDQKFENKLLLRRFLLEQKPVRSALFAIWNFLTPSELTAIEQNNLKSQAFLEKVGLIQNNLLTISILLDYVKERAKHTKSQEVKFSEKGEILKGEVAISDKLTSLEFKLLKYLIEKRGEIIPKDEIINAVWGDQKTTLGVTDQALDQLVFRLRKKVEENPNNPKYIQTVKGRGFKFSS